MIEIRLKNADLAPGGTVEGTATWMPSGGKPPRALVVTISWKTEGRGNTDEGKIHEVRQECVEAGGGLGGHPGLGAPASISFSERIPPEGPISFEGKLIRILWGVSVRADIAWAFDEVEKVPFTVRPRTPA